MSNNIRLIFIKMSCGLFVLFLILSGCGKDLRRSGQKSGKPSTLFFQYMEKGDYALFYQGKKDQAIRYYTSAIHYWAVWDGKENLAQAYYNRGGAYYEARNRKKAIADLRQAAGLGHPDACRVLKEDFKIDD